MIRALTILVVSLFTSCASYPKPDASIVTWDVADPLSAAKEHADRIYGIAFVIAPTGSMEPYLTGGDCVVGDFAAPWKDVQPGKTLLYDANWLDPEEPLVCHMAVAQTVDRWIMTGIANRYSEAGALALMEADYRATVVAVYTSRKKP